MGKSYVISEHTLNKIITQLEMIGEIADDLNELIVRLKLIKENQGD